MTVLILLQAAQRIGPEWMGIVVPASILLLSCWVTWALYKHFSK
jgi:hypothetical protein